MIARLFSFALAFALAACGGGKNDHDSLTAKSTGPVLGSSCTACHGYPLKDYNHDYHLFRAPRNDQYNGSITCLDCHSRSIKSQKVMALDSVFGDDVVGKYHSLGHPGDTARNSDGVVIRSLSLSRVDSLPQNHPVALPPRPGSFPDFQEYVTALGHLNGTVDVVFDPRNSSPSEFDGDSANYNPKMETCSAVSCHPEAVYSWGSKSKNLPELPPVGVQE